MSRKFWSPIVIFTICAFISVAASGQSSARREASDSKPQILFSGVELRDAIKQLCAQLKLNVVFDDTFRNVPKYDLELNDVTTEGALRVIFIQNKLTARLIENKTIFIYLDNPNNNSRFGDYPIWPMRK